MIESYFQESLKAIYVTVIEYLERVHQQDKFMFITQNDEMEEDLTSKDVSKQQTLKFSDPLDRM